MVRANVLIQHNRPDARSAAKYVVDHFADRIDQQPTLAKMREYLRTHGDTASLYPVIACRGPLRTLRA